MLAIFSWVAMSFTDLTILFSKINDINPGIEDYIPNIFFFTYTLALFSFYKFRIERAESLNFIDLLWKIFVTGLITTVASLAIKSLDILMGDTKLMENLLVIDLQFLLHIGLLIAFLVSTLVVWKRLILYQKSKFLLRTWAVFEYTLYASLLTGFLPATIQEYVLYSIVLLGLFLSVNMKWVAFLTFRQKWKSILLLMLTILYLVYFYISLTQFRTANPDIQMVAENSVFIRAAFIFSTTYAAFSLLVILFNLPTSSAFEQKLDEVVNFQRLSQSIQTEQSEEQVYEILLDSAIRVANADAAWIETNIDGEISYFTHQINTDQIKKIKQFVVDKNLKGVLDFDSADRNLKGGQHLAKLKDNQYKSIVAFPLITHHEQTGMLVLLREVSEGFTRELSEITETFVNQAAISIEGFRLMSQALENERYKEELKIAKQVQSKLLPKVLEGNDDFDIVAFSEAADEVGGDYYDAYRISEDRVALIIGDVSGKGTSAAFHMAQMKGVFHSLAQLNLTTAEFLINANQAISTGLDKTSFITISYFIINQKEKQVEFARAGHCPTLFYNKGENTSSYFTNKGLGLGIIRNKEFENYVQVCHFNYKPGDVMVLYTDGITEAKNSRDEEYGYERLKAVLKENSQESVEDIQVNIIGDLYEFCEQNDLDDDYTTVILKFK